MKKRKKKKEETEVRIDYPLFEYMQPQGGIIFREPNYILTGDGYTKIIHIYRLPTLLKDYWLDQITNIEDTITLVDISTRDKYDVQKNINRALMEELSREHHAKDFEEMYDAQKRQQQLRLMYDEIQSMGEVVKMLHFRIFVSGKSLVMLEQRAGEIMMRLETAEFMPTVLLNEGKTEWKSMFQSYTRQRKEPFAIKGLSLMTEQIAGGYPFRWSDLVDERGTLLGFTNCGGCVVFDDFAVTDRRKHYNSVAIGDMGSGKSTLLKKMFRKHAEKGDYLRTFDISGEFSNLTREFGGRIIRCDGKEGMLNPFEILRAGDNESTNFARHINKITTFYQCLVPTAEVELLLDLQNLLQDFYDSLKLTQKFGRITGLPADRYPKCSDFLEFLSQQIEEKTREAEQESDVRKELIIKEITGIKRLEKSFRAVVDNYGQMFDGKTTMDNLTDEKIITFDISGIKDLGNVFAAQLFNMMYLCYDGVVSNGEFQKELYESGELSIDEVTRFLIIVDESHRWINTKYPFILDVIFVLLREMRKYFAGMTMASQSFRDYVIEGSDDAALQKLKVIFELTQYKFIFRQDSSVLPLVDKIFGNVLSPWQRDKIPLLSRGETILSISGDRNIYFKVWLSKEYEQTLFSGGV